MKTEFLIAITQLSAEKNLPKEAVLQAVESALVPAFKKEGFAPNQNITVKIHPATGDMKVFVLKTVVEEVADPGCDISLSDAKRIKPGASLGDVVEVESTPKHAGRIAAQTAKQVILQRLREAEREAVFEEYADKKDDILGGVVQRIELKQITINLGKAEAILPISEQMKTDHYRVGQRVKVYLLDVLRTNKGPQLVVSRAHRNLLRRLFELEVPEIHSGVVEIKAIAREPGFRSKVAVAARQPGVDPVGSCVGLRGIRVQNIVNELSGERIDVVQWHADPAAFIANALSPAQVARVEISEAEKTATVVVADRQLSLAIGKEGQNARLAAKLSGWRIDIKPSSVADAEQAEKEAQKAEQAAVPAVEVAPPSPEPVASAEAVAAVAEAVATAEKVLVEAPVPVEEAVAKPVAVEASPFPAVPQIRFAEDVGIATSGKPDIRVKKTKKKGAPGAKKEELEGARAKKPRKVVASRWEGEGEEEESEY